MPSGTPHDALFKRVFSQLDQARAHLEWVEATWGNPVLIYVLYEHRSTPEPQMALRAHRYVARVMDRWSADHPEGVPPQVITLVLYHGQERWTPPRRLTALQGVPASLGELPGAECTYHLVELTGDSSRWGLALGILALLLLKYGHTRELWSRLMGWTDLLKRAVRETGLRAFEITLSYIAWVDRETPTEVFLTELRERLDDTPTEAIIMSWAEQLLDEGREKGRREAVRDVLLRLLSARFSDVPESVEAAIRTARLDQLDRWVERFVTAGSPEELIAEDR